MPSSDYYIVSDKDYEKLPVPADIRSFHAWQATEGKQNVLSAAEKLYRQLTYQVTSGEYELYELNKRYGPIMFVGLFFGVVFFVSAGSFLYFRLYMDVDGDKQKFMTIARMCLSEKELKKVLGRQTAILFFAPIVALIHGAVALSALSSFFFYNLAKESAIVLSVFLAIQMIYFFIVRYFYTKQIKAAIHM
ncbi:hypothetical protein [Paenibacillus harenae]|uniref:ABC transporter permease n=1 Tax=Paenibacillus harenae TaxID=306543 RepID=A0ABT9UD85_PAEHA|nr:hypothetical protein [Paenibacillus harenae]MDQ0116635.1 hypothetical protein [Paenibacillus harenae]